MTTIEVAKLWQAFQELLREMELDDIQALKRHIFAIEKYLMRELERSKRQ